MVALNGAVNRARPYPGYAGINFRQTTAHNLYHGLLVGFRHDAGRAGLLNISYTLSRAKTSATNDRDAIDVPQNPLDLEAEYALARTDRTHVFTANYVYELPFFKNVGRAGQVRPRRVAGLRASRSSGPARPSRGS